MVGVLAFVFASCGKSQTKLRNEKDSVSYALGMVQGYELLEFDSTVNVAALAQAIDDILNNKKTALLPEEYDRYLQDYYMLVKPMRDLEESREFLAKIEKQDNVKKSPSGLLYEIVTEGDASVKISGLEDAVAVNLVGRFKNGREFENTMGNGVAVLLENAVPGWVEGVSMIGKGGRIKLWIPPALGYAEMGSGIIPPNEALFFDIELLDIIPADSLGITDDERFDSMLRSMQ